MSYHLDVVDGVEVAVAIATVEMVLGLMLLEPPLGRPGLVAVRALPREVILGQHMLLSSLVGVEPGIAGVALELRAGMACGVAIIVARPPNKGDRRGSALLFPSRFFP